MKYVLLTLLLGCHRVFGLDGLDDVAAPDASVMRDGVAPDTSGAAVDAETGCDLVAQTGCSSPTAACYPQAGDDFCAEPGDGLDGAACTVDPDCTRGYFCAEVAGPGSGVCFRICNCATSPGSTCTQPTTCSSTATHQCRQYTTTFGYCEL